MTALVVSDNASHPNAHTLSLGLDPFATDGIDALLGELELPPPPPTGNFDARFILPANNFSGISTSYSDFRRGSSRFIGTVEYRLRFQKHISADRITISWRLPERITAELKDIVTGTLINVPMSGTGSYIVSDPGAFSQLRMIVKFQLAPQILVPFTVSDNAPVPNSKLLSIGLDSAATDGIDTLLEEHSLPAMPAAGIFEARMILPQNSFSGSLASYSDYRYGSFSTTGVYEYRLKFQKQSTASAITINWMLPPNITGVLTDILTGSIVNVIMSGSGSYTVANPTTINQLKMLIKYEIAYINIRIKAIPEGLLNYSGTALTRRDTLTAYLAHLEMPDKFLDSSKFLVDSITFSGIATFYNAASGYYYLIVRGQNTILTWSCDGGMTLTKGNTAWYNYDSVASQAYASNMVRIGSHWCMYSGDVNNDGFVNYSDLREIDAKLITFTRGNRNCDLNGDGIVDFTDLKICDNNAVNLVRIRRPR